MGLIFLQGTRTTTDGVVNAMAGVMQGTQDT